MNLISSSLPNLIIHKQICFPNIVRKKYIRLNVNTPNQMLRQFVYKLIDFDAIAGCYTWLFAHIESSLFGPFVYWVNKVYS